MVKSVVNGVKTIFISPAYQIKDGVVTKTYPGGAFREGSTLYYSFSDHLGSTSITLGPNGEKAEMRYKAWGEVRYSSGDTHTDKAYTGQRSYVDDFGLQYYNARWYDSTIGMFAQADTIIPGGVQGLDRYAYVQNNPVNFADPSGHDSDCSKAHESARSACESSNQKYWQSITNVLILICGTDMQGACIHRPNKTYIDNGYYSGFGPFKQGIQPLMPERNWANKQNSVTYLDFATGTCGNPAAEQCSDNLSQEIAQRMSDIAGMNPDIKFTIVGFSGGAPFSTGLAMDAINKGVAGNNIKIIQLDTILGAARNSQANLDILRAQEVQISFFHSGTYQRNQPLPADSVPAWVWNHTDLAINVRVFNINLIPALTWK